MCVTGGNVSPQIYKRTSHSCQSLIMRPYLEIRLLQLEQVKMRSYWSRVALFLSQCDWHLYKKETFGDNHTHRVVPYEDQSEAVTAMEPPEGGRET